MPAALIPAMIIGGATQVAGAAIGAHAAGSAAKTQTQAANHALDVQQQMYQQTLNNVAPYMQAGQSAMSTMGNVLNPYRNAGAPPPMRMGPMQVGTGAFAPPPPMPQMQPMQWDPRPFTR